MSLPRNAFASVPLVALVTSNWSVNGHAGLLQSTLSVLRSRNSTLTTTVSAYLVATCCSLNAATDSVIDCSSPIRTASTPVRSGTTLYRPRPISSDRTRSVNRCSMSKTGVWFANSGTPIVLMCSGRNEPRPASE